MDARKGVFGRRGRKEKRQLGKKGEKKAACANSTSKKKGLLAGGKERGGRTHLQKNYREALKYCSFRSAKETHPLASKRKERGLAYVSLI